MKSQVPDINYTSDVADRAMNEACLKLCCRATVELGMVRTALGPHWYLVDERGDCNDFITTAVLPWLRTWYNTALRTT